MAAATPFLAQDANADGKEKVVQATPFRAAWGGRGDTQHLGASRKKKESFGDHSSHLCLTAPQLPPCVGRAGHSRLRREQSAGSPETRCPALSTMSRANSADELPVASQASFVHNYHTEKPQTPVENVELLHPRASRTLSEAQTQAELSFLRLRGKTKIGFKSQEIVFVLFFFFNPPM